MALSIGFRILSFLPSCYSSYGALNSYPDGTFTHCSCQPSLDAHLPVLVFAAANCYSEVSTKTPTERETQLSVEPLRESRFTCLSWNGTHWPSASQQSCLSAKKSVMNGGYRNRHISVATQRAPSHGTTVCAAGPLGNRWAARQIILNHRRNLSVMFIRAR